MRIYFYHMIPVKSYHADWKANKVPGHLLYGMTHLPRHGMTCIYDTPSFNPYQHKWKLMFFNLWKALIRMRSYDAVYAVTHTGLELVIFLRALGLFRKPIVLWHHSAVIHPKGRIRRWGSKLFYKGIDRMLFFSDYLLNESLKTGKVKREQAFMVHWGADLDFYNRLLERRKASDHFISTGRENRDFVTLIKAFNRLDVPCDIYTTRFGGRVNDYELLLRREIERIHPNIHFHIVQATHLEMAEKANNAYAVLVCCLNFPYTIGLTSLVEAFALGLPVITTDNKTFPFDVEKEQIGLKIPYGDVNGWVKAIRYLTDHREVAQALGRNGRKFAENNYNLDICSQEVAQVLLTL